MFPTALNGIFHVSGVQVSTKARRFATNGLPIHIKEYVLVYQIDWRYSAYNFPILRDLRTSKALKWGYWYEEVGRPIMEATYYDITKNYFKQEKNVLKAFILPSYRDDDNPNRMDLRVLLITGPAFNEKMLYNLTVPSINFLEEPDGKPDKEFPEEVISSMGGICEVLKGRMISHIFDSSEDDTESDED